MRLTLSMCMRNQRFLSLGCVIAALTLFVYDEAAAFQGVFGGGQVSYARSKAHHQQQQTAPNAFQLHSRSGIWKGEPSTRLFSTLELVQQPSSSTPSESGTTRPLPLQVTAPPPDIIFHHSSTSTGSSSGSGVERGESDVSGRQGTTQAVTVNEVKSGAVESADADQGQLRCLLDEVLSFLDPESADVASRTLLDSSTTPNRATKGTQSGKSGINTNKYAIANVKVPLDENIAFMQQIAAGGGGKCDGFLRNYAFKGEKIQDVRVSYMQTERAQTVSVSIYPAPEYDFPVFGAIVLCTPSAMHHGGGGGGPPPSGGGGGSGGQGGVTTTASEGQQQARGAAAVTAGTVGAAVASGHIHSSSSAPLSSSSAPAAPPSAAAAASSSTAAVPMTIMAAIDAHPLFNHDEAYMQQYGAVLADTRAMFPELQMDFARDHYLDSPFFSNSKLMGRMAVESDVPSGDVSGSGTGGGGGGGGGGGAGGAGEGVVRRVLLPALRKALTVYAGVVQEARPRVVSDRHGGGSGSGRIGSVITPALVDSVAGMMHHQQHHATAATASTSSTTGGDVHVVDSDDGPVAAADVMKLRLAEFDTHFKERERARPMLAKIFGAENTEAFFNDFKYRFAE